MEAPLPPVRVALARSLRPDDVGHRVMIRRRDGDTLRDVLGQLVAWTGNRLVVHTRGGGEVEVALADVVAAKTIPAPPSRRRRASSSGPGSIPIDATIDVTIDDLDLERVAAHGWPAIETAHLGAWLLRASEGFTGRGNSVLPLGSPGRPLAEALAFVDAWYGERGLRPIVVTPLPAMGELDAHLVAGGWTPYNATIVRYAALEHVLATVPERPHLPPVTFRDSVDERWLGAYHYRGATTLPAVAVRMLESSPRRAFAAVEDDDGRMLAIGRVAVADGWAGITAVEVADHARRRGLGAHIMRALCRWGVDAGARGGYLQVAEENAAAQSFYQRLGFAEHHRYRYLRAPGRAAPDA